MKLSTKGRYAMVALVDIAMQPEDGLVTLSDISRRQDISLPYLEQLFVKLRRAKLVASVRGPGAATGCRGLRPKSGSWIFWPPSTRRLTPCTRVQARRVAHRDPRRNR